MRHKLWGREGDLDFWSALARGEVDGPEQKAVDLLRRVVDERRFGLYCQTGQLPIMGNITRRHYLALKSGGALELEDGAVVAWWCFSVGPYAPDIPDTDQVMSVRMIVEGEELAMFTTGDRHHRGYHLDNQEISRAPGVVDPFIVPFVGKGSRRRPDVALRTVELLDLADLRPEPMVSGGMANVQVAQGYGVQYVTGDMQKQAEEPVLKTPQEVALEREERANMVAVGLGDDSQAEALMRDDPVTPDMRARINAAVARDIADYVDRALAVRAPILADNAGVDMHDGTALYVDERRALEVMWRTGIDVHAEIQHMQDEGYTPDVIEYAVNGLLGAVEFEPAAAARL